MLGRQPPGEFPSWKHSAVVHCGAGQCLCDVTTKLLWHVLCTVYSDEIPAASHVAYKTTWYACMTLIYGRMFDSWVTGPCSMADLRLRVCIAERYTYDVLYSLHNTSATVLCHKESACLLHCWFTYMLLLRALRRLSTKIKTIGRRIFAVS